MGAEELSPGTIRFGHELVDFQQESEHVVATIHDHQANRTYDVRAQYMLGCDGGRRVGAKLVIAMGIIVCVQDEQAASMRDQGMIA